MFAIRKHINIFNMEAEAYHLFEKYLNNDLSRSEKEEFEKRISDDPEFAEAFQIYKEISISLEAKENREAGEKKLRKNLEELSDEYFNINTRKKPAKIISLRRVLELAAASIIIVLGTWFILNQTQSKPTYSEYADYGALALTERGEDDSVKILAENLFNNEQYEEAVGILEKIHVQDPENNQIKLYLAMALIETEQYERADTLLTEIRENESVYQYRAVWYLALSYLKQGDIEATKAVLKEIPESAAEYNKARELLDEL